MVNWFLLYLQEKGVSTETKELMNHYMDKYPKRIRNMPNRVCVTGLLRGDKRFKKDDSSKRVKWYISNDGKKWLEEQKSCQEE